MINNNIFPCLAVAGQRANQGEHEPYRPIGFWNGHLIDSSPSQIPPFVHQAFCPPDTAQSQYCLPTVPSPVIGPGLNYIPSFIHNAVPVMVSAQWKVRLLQLIMQAIDHQRDGKAMTMDIYHWLEQYDPIRFPLQNSRAWRNQVRGYLSNRRDLFVKTAEKGTNCKTGRMVRSYYWCCKSPQSAPCGKKGKPVRVPVSRSAIAVTPQMHATAMTSTTSAVGRASTISQI